MPSIYFETTIPGYLTAWPAKNLVIAAHQAITREWWELRRHRFELFTSQLVVEEVSAGDEAAAQLRLDALKGIPLLGSSSAVFYSISVEAKDWGYRIERGSEGKPGTLRLTPTEAAIETVRKSLAELDQALAESAEPNAKDKEGTATPDATSKE